jgi:sterol desaturase/sphingolipid hydroxylase (fatty acid hydroxylase superfamily)
VNLSYAQAVALAVPVFLGLMALEFLVDRVRRTRYFRLADALNSLSCGIVSTGMRVFFGFLGVFFYDWALRLTPLRLPGGSWAAWVFAFFLYDLCYYWQHRLGHTVRLFWAAHVVHHQSEEFNLTTALRQPGTGSFTGWIFYLPMAMCGVPLGMYLVVGVIQLFYQFWPHTRLIGRLGFLDSWIQTPSNHRVHHAQNDVYLDKNYVGVFLIWDRLFGTFQEELDDTPPVYGIRGQLLSWNPVWANLYYYWEMARDSWRTRRWRDKLGVWFGSPAFHPADLPAKPEREFVLFDPPRPLGLSIYALLQFTALMAANSHFLALLPKQTTAWSVVYFLWIVASLVVLGGLLENRREFLWLEAARLAVTSAAAAIAGSWFGAPPAVVLAFLGLSFPGLLLAQRTGQSDRLTPVGETT